MFHAILFIIIKSLISLEITEIQLHKKRFRDIIKV